MKCMVFYNTIRPSWNFYIKIIVYLRFYVLLRFFCINISQFYSITKNYITKYKISFLIYQALSDYIIRDMIK